MKKINILILAAMMCGFVSCSDFIEPKSHSEVIPGTMEELNELMLGQGYPGMSITGGDNSGFVSFLEVINDDVSTVRYSGLGEAAYEGAYSVRPIYTWQSTYFSEVLENATAPNELNLYTPHYYSISACNAVLDYIDDVTGTQAQRDHLLAQAYTMRGYLYFRLANIYGEPYNHNPQALAVPIMTNSEISDDPIRRQTVEKVYERVEQDLLLGLAHYQALSEDMQWKKNYRASLPMVQLLLSRVYLYMEKWSLAAYYAEQLITQTDFPELKLYNLNNLPAPTLEKPKHNFISYTNPEVIMLHSGVKDMTSFSRVNVQDGSDHLPYYTTSDEFLNLFEYDDLRKEAYLVQHPGTGNYWAYGKIDILPNNDLTPNTANTNSGMAFRLAEAYLNYAEANAMLYLEGSAYAMGEALRAMNELRYNRISSASYSPETYMEADELLQFVRNERRKELCFEGHRWFDLRRYGMPRIEHLWAGSGNPAVYVLEEKDPAYTLRLPDKVVENNTYLEPSPTFPERLPQ